MITKRSFQGKEPISLSDGIELAIDFLFVPTSLVRTLAYTRKENSLSGEMLLMGTAAVMETCRVGGYMYLMGVGPYS